jgi:hypothetical protein
MAKPSKERAARQDPWQSASSRLGEALSWFILVAGFLSVASAAYLMYVGVQQRPLFGRMGPYWRARNFGPPHAALAVAAAQ